MGLVQALDYKLPVPSAVQRGMWRISSSRPGAWLFARSLPQVDKFVLRMSRGQVTLAGIAAAEGWQMEVLFEDGRDQFLVKCW